MPAATLTREELNRATLARQMLLGREKTTALKAVERLAGLQAQLARPPFIGLWSRVAGFEAEDLRRLVRERKVVRGTLMRGTLHLMSAKDYRVVRPLLQPMLSRAMAGVLRERAKGLDVEAVVETARGCLEKEPQTFEALRGRLLQAYPKLNDRALGYAVRTHLPLVQVPDDGPWGYPAAAAFAVAESFLRKRLPPGDDLRPLVLRYLGAFGPATPRDAAAWSGLEEVAAAFEPLRPQLRVFRDERGRELFDLPKAPRPPARTPAPVRFLPDYDNLLLAHADRTRVIADEHRRRVATANLRILPTFLVDGFVAGTWKVERSRAAAVLVLEAFRAVSRPARAALLEEGGRLLRFVESDARTAEVRVAP
jgi:hypothetical protein